MSVNDIGILTGAIQVNHTRRYDNLENAQIDGLNGYGWVTSKPPQIHDDMATYYRVEYAGNSIINFGKTPDSQGVCHALDGYHDKMEIDSINKKFIITRSDNTIWSFYNDPSVNATHGLIKTVIASNGDTTEFVYSGSKLSKVQSSHNSNPSVLLSELEYIYNVQGRISQIILKKRIDATLVSEKRVTYVYYGTSDGFGNEGDLKTVTSELYQNSTWTQGETYHYRYYKSNDAYGTEHALKMAFFPSEFELFSAAFGSSACLTTSDSQSLNYSSKYYEYDSKQRVILEKVERNRKTIRFEYTEYEEHEDYNAIHRKTVEYGPYGNKTVVVTNFKGNVLIREEIAPEGTNEPSAIHCYQYNSDGNRVHYFTPKSVLGYSIIAFDHDEPEILLRLSDSDGVIEITDYFDGNNSPPKGFIKRESIRKGQYGTLIVKKEYEYTKYQVGDMTTWNVSKITQYEDDAKTKALTTQYAYTYFSGTTKIEQKTTTFPVVSVEKNGNGSTSTFVERFDLNGRLIWTKDELGIITYNQYDPAIDLCIKTIQDVDTSITADFNVTVPPGWSTISGAGKHLVSDFEYDSQRRPTQTLGPKNTTVGSGNLAITTRAANWIVYDDVNRKIMSASGYATVSTTDVVTGYTLNNPVTIRLYNTLGSIKEDIQAKRSSPVGKLLISDQFVRSDYVAWTKNIYDGSDILYSRQYFNIPTSGDGTKDVHYHETEYVYDGYGRRNQIISPDGTIVKNVLDWRDHVTHTYVGTHSTNLALVAETIYGSDGECPTCTGLETKPKIVIKYVDSNTKRTTEFSYDWRGRLVRVHEEEDADGNSIYTLKSYDNMDRVIKVEQFLATPSADRLIGRTEQFYDERGRLWKAERSIVNPETGVVQGKVLAKEWFDAKGRAIKTQGFGDNCFRKNVFDSTDRVVKSYFGHNTSDNTYSTASTILNDTILQQIEYSYDSIGNIILTTSVERMLNQTATGELKINSSPKGRYEFVANWYAPTGHNIAVANYGTNGDVFLSRPATVPQRSDTILVEEYVYDTNTSRAIQTINPSNKKSCTTYDALGRVVKTITNYVNGTPSALTPDVDVTVEMSYHPSGQIAALTAKNPTTGDQVTKYVYGTSKTTIAPLVFRNDLLVAEIYPDSDNTESSGIFGNGSGGIYDRIEYQYNRLGERIWRKDQNETIHTYEYDNLGRIIHDRVTTLGAGVDGMVRRISTVYNSLGQSKSVTSYDNPTVGSGSIVNEIKYEYDTNGLLAKELQSPNGAVTGSSLYVGYSYDSTKSGEYFTKRFRPTSMRYPSAETANYNYGASGSLDDSLNRLVSIKDGATTLVEYTDVGYATPAIVSYPQPGLALDYTAAGAVDRFSRIADHAWKKGAADVARIKYGYDRLSIRTYREDIVATNAGKSLDELYQYDGINQIVDMQRGKLSSTQNAIASGKNFAESFTFDSMGNFSGYKQDSDGNGTFDINQSRTHSKANEIATIAGASTYVSSDRNGNMTKCTKPNNWSANYNLVYDAWNRLVIVKDANNTTLIAEYRYDGVNRRVLKKTYASGTLAETRTFYYNSNWQCLEEYVGTAYTARYFWGIRYIDDLVFRKTPTEQLYVLHDANWNVVAVTNTSGVVLERMIYNPFGKATIFDANFTSRAASLFNWTRTYTGQILDLETGLMLYRFRFYHPDLGRFISRDLIKYRSNDPNLMRYTVNNPLILIDPNGLKEEKYCTKISLPISQSVSGPKTLPQIGLIYGWSISMTGEAYKEDCTFECCPGCCDLDTTVTDTEVSISITGRASAFIGGGFQIEIPYFQAKGYIGVKGEGAISFAVSLSGKTKKCYGVNEIEAKACCDATKLTGELTIGAMFSVEWGWFKYKIGGECFGKFTLDFGSILCVTCNTSGCEASSLSLPNSINYSIGCRVCLGVCYEWSYQGKISLI